MIATLYKVSGFVLYILPGRRIMKKQVVHKHGAFFNNL